MAEDMKLVVQSRETSGSANARRLRRSGFIPGVLMNDKGESKSIQLNSHDLEQMLHHHASENLILDVEVDGKSNEKALLRSVQRNPVTDRMVHADFSVISMTKKMRLRIPITLVGESVGVAQNGGVLEHLLRELEVECRPMDLVEDIKVDVSALQIGDSIQVSALKIGPEFVIVTDMAAPVASVLAPRVEEEEVPAVPTDGAEPEVIGEKERAEAAAAEEDGDKKGSDKKGAEKGAEKKAEKGAEKGAEKKAEKGAEKKGAEKK